MKKITPFILPIIFLSLFIAAVIWLSSNVETDPDILSGKFDPGDGVLRLEAPDSASISAIFTAKLIIDTQDQSINAVGAYLEYDNQKLRIINMDTTESFCQFYPENKYDNQKGTINIACGAPSPGFNGINTLAKITFEPFNIGTAEITMMPESQLLLNDGKGTNILHHFPNHNINILTSI